MSSGELVVGRWLAWSLITIACGCGAWHFGGPTSTGLQRWFRSHAESLQRELRFLRSTITGKQLAGMQAVLVLAGSMSAVLGCWSLAGLVLPLPLLVSPVLGTRVDARLDVLEDQIEGWLLALAGGLSSSASLGQALEESTSMVCAPLRDELVVALQDVALGVGVGEALDRMAARVRSPTLSTAVAAIRIGQRTGGGLVETLRRCAETLREMARLEGVVRTRTAEGRAQVTVVALIPFPMVALLHSMNPTLMQPLWRHPLGPWVVALALGLWGGSIVLARRILDVDI